MREKATVLEALKVPTHDQEHRHRNFLLLFLPFLLSFPGAYKAQLVKI